MDGMTRETLTKYGIDVSYLNNSWSYLSSRASMPYEFIEKYQDKIDWKKLCSDQIMNESFIRYFEKRVNWYAISANQVLSEKFIDNYHNKLNWFSLCKHQDLSEKLMTKYTHLINWSIASKYQEMSERFIRWNRHKVNWWHIAAHQKLSKEFRNEFNLYVPNNNWLYESINKKIKYIQNSTKYKMIDNEHIEAWKPVEKIWYSIHFPAKYYYEEGKRYASRCDCDCNMGNSYGLNAWESFKNVNGRYPDKNILRVKIRIDDIGAIIKWDNLLRCRELKVMERIEV